MSLKNRVNDLELCESGFGQSLIEALNMAKEGLLPKRPDSTEAELNEIIATNKETSMTAKIARAQLRILYRLNYGVKEHE
jgi:hypothetical protein